MTGRMRLCFCGTGELAGAGACVFVELGAGTAEDCCGLTVSAGQVSDEFGLEDGNGWFISGWW